MDRVSQAWTFAKGLGIAAPQIGIGRAAALIRTTDDALITLLNPRVVEALALTDEQYEGCLSFFDVRCMVLRPLTIHVEHQDVRGRRQITVFDRGVARLVAHEIDHLRGILCRDLLASGTLPVPIAEYRGTGATWQHDIFRDPVRDPPYRDRDGREVDFVLESPDGRIVGIEVKASVSPPSDADQHLRWMRRKLGDRFTGVLSHSGRHAVSLGDDIWSLPVSALWGHRGAVHPGQRRSAT